MYTFFRMPVRLIIAQCIKSLNPLVGAGFLKENHMKINKEIDKIEGITQVLREKLETLQTKIDDREEKFGERSEKWQESDKGCEFQEETDRLSDLHIEIESEIENIEGALETLRELSE